MAHMVSVMTRAGCAACQRAEQEVERVCAELGVAWQVLDVDTDSEWRAEYGDRVPVILIDEHEHGYWAVEPDRLRAALAGR